MQLGHRVTFIPDNLANEPPYTGELQKRGIEVVYHPYVKKVRDYLISHGSNFDVVVLSRCDFARKQLQTFACMHHRAASFLTRLIFTTSVKTARRANRDPEMRRKAQEKQRLEHELIDQADETWVVSPSSSNCSERSGPKSLSK